MGFVSERHLSDRENALRLDIQQLGHDLARERTRAQIFLETISALEAEVVRQRQANAEQTVEIRRLTDIIASMIRDGFHPAGFVSVDAAAPEREPLDPEITRAVDMMADPGSTLHARLLEDAYKMRDREGLPTNQIIGYTLRGAAYEPRKDDVETTDPS